MKQLKISYGAEILQTIQRYDLYKTWQDLFLPTNEREYSFLKYGISSEDIRKLRHNVGDKPPDSKEELLSLLHGKTYRIKIAHPVLNDHGMFYPRGLQNYLLFEITLADQDFLINYSDTTKKNIF